MGIHSGTDLKISTLKLMVSFNMAVSLAYKMKYRILLAYKVTQNFIGLQSNT